MPISGTNFDRLDNLSELTEAIEMGLDIEFVLRGIRYNISTDGTPFIAVCPTGNGIHYTNAQELVEKHRIDGRPLKEMWQEVEILAM